MTRANASPLGFLPPALGAVLGALTLRLLIAALRRWRGNLRQSGASTEVDRRRFLLLAGGGALVAVIVGVGSQLGQAAGSSIVGIRKALRLPAPRSRVHIPAGAELRIPGLSPLFTPNADFYRVDTALTVPAVDPSTWRLTIDGMVEKRIRLSFQDLLRMGLGEYAITMTCVSNEVGGNLVGNARWLGVPVRDLLALARPRSGADMVLSRSVDGFTASTPLGALTDHARDAILAVGMNGEPLPLEHGFPVRMVVPGLYGYVFRNQMVDRAESHDLRRRPGLLDPSGLQCAGTHQTFQPHRHPPSRQSDTGGPHHDRRRGLGADRRHPEG
ncbi:MAG: molybdopterin-dependent oxidoreductase, partial [Leifsonia sp.]